MDSNLEQAYRHLRHGETKRVEYLIIGSGLGPDPGPRARADVLRGRVLLEQDRFSSALTHFDAAAESDPHDPVPRSWQIAALEKLWRIGDAEQAAEGALADFPEDPLVLVAAGRLAMWQLNQSRALAYFEQACDLSPSDPNALEWHITGLRYSYRYPEALAANERALQLNPEVIDLHNELSLCFEDVGLYDNAYSAAAAAYEQDPFDQWTLRRMVRTSRLLGRWERAEELLRDSVDRLPEEAWPCSDLAGLLWSRGRLTEALALYRKAEELQPDLVESVVGTADVLRELGRHDEAERHLTARDGSIEASVRLWRARADVRLDLSRPAEALSLAVQTLDEYPFLTDAMRKRVTCLEVSGYLDKAVEVSRGYVEKFPQETGLRTQLAWLLATAQGPHAALVEFQAAAEIDIQSIAAARGVARMLGRMQRLDEAHDGITARRRSRPLDAQFAVEAAWLYDDGEEYAAALPCLERALTLDPCDSQALLWRTITLRKLGRIRQAEAAAADALMVSPDRNDLLDEQLRLLDLQGRRRDADAVLRRVLEGRQADLYVILRVVRRFNDSGQHEEAMKLLEQLGQRSEDAAVVDWRVHLLISIREFTKAESLAERAIVRFGRLPRLLTQLAFVREAFGRYEEAVQLYDEILCGFPADAWVQGWYLDALCEQEEFEKAESAAREACVHRPYSANSRANLAHVLERCGRYEAALEEWVEADRIDPINSFYMCGRIRVLRMLGRLSEAEAVAREGMRRFPSDGDPMRELGHVLDALGRFEEAIAVFNAHPVSGPYPASSQESVSAALRSMRRFDEALRLMEQWVRERPHRMSARAELGWVYRDSRQYGRAAAVFHGLFEESVSPRERAVAACGLGWIALDQHRHHEAERHFRLALGERCYSTTAHLGLAWVQVRSDDRTGDDEAERLCWEVLARRPMNQEAHTCLGVLNFRRGRLAAAEHHLRRAVELDGTVGSRVDLGAFLAHLGRQSEAEELLRRVIERDPFDAAAHLEMGNVLLQRALSETDPKVAADLAIYHFRQAEAAWPESAAASLGVALAHAQGGQGGFPAAEEALRRAIGLPESDTPRWQLQLALARLLLQEGDATQRVELYEEALETATEVIALVPRSAEPYFVAGVAEYKLGEGEATIYLRPWRRLRAKGHLRMCLRLDNSQFEARRVLRALDRSTRLSRPAAFGSATLTTLAVALLCTLWVAFLTGNSRVDGAMVSILTPLMIGLVALGVLLPLINRLRLPGGVEAYLTASLSQVSSGPTGDPSSGPGRLSFGPGRLAAKGGPFGRPPRRE
ncbi:tetratricopeptide repeat protein [Micromonospora lupini]|uniref:Uncharacterized protein n=1 Tax=Micromonospora lupini str. Lupac 08 TaxID=1150864 RepID=I0LC03_9ACTN|nr:tetratricopeptide repeat protein [Micromonospora lupini]CCH21350.1 hypothetical protein; putative TPR repeats [Micromonospora lupini str. Lupac 08]